MIKTYIQRFPFLVRLIMQFKKHVLRKSAFVNSTQYWADRYKNRGNSGSGSYDHLAEFKAEVINGFVKANQIQSVVEFGCGDGNQLRYFEIPHYLGVDISPDAVQWCRHKFAHDTSKSFVISDEYDAHIQSDVAMSLDVIYHLVEDDVYEAYMTRLFSAARKFVIVYSSNEDKPMVMDHVKSRKFSTWVEANRPEFKLIKFIPNKYPIGSPGKEIKSIADFYIYERLDR